MAISISRAQHLIQILGTKPYLNENPLLKQEGIRIISSWNFNNNARVLYNRGFPCFYSVVFPINPHNSNLVCSSCFRLPVFHLALFPLRRNRSSPLWPLLMSHNNGSIAPQEPTKTMRCVIKGRVQGVFYRNWTIENATQLGLKGWVRNRRDGSVEALFSGKPEAVDEMQLRCRRGPPDAMVTGFEAYPSDEDPGAGFERKHTV